MLYSVRVNFEDFAHVMKEYFRMGHAELVIVEDLNKPHQNVYYLPMHVVKSETRSTSKFVQYSMRLLRLRPGHH